MRKLKIFHGNKVEADKIIEVRIRTKDKRVIVLKKQKYLDGYITKLSGDVGMIDLRGEFMKIDYYEQ